MKLISIVVPCYNEEDNVSVFYHAVTSVFRSITEKIDFEFIFVNDGSKDGTRERLKELSKTSNNVGYIDFSRNFGKEAAMLAGLEAVKGDAVVIMDADLQDPPELMKDMIYEWLYNGYDVVYTRRKNRSGEPVIRSWFAKQFYRIINKMSEVRIVDGARDYRLMDRKVIENILELKERNRFSKGLFMWVGFTSKCIEFENVERNAGSSSWSFIKLFRYAIDGIVSFTTSPLHWATYFGFITAASSFIYLMYIIISKIVVGNSVSGYASLVSFLLFFGGVQLIFLGIIGEYIGRIFIEIKSRPHYVIREQKFSEVEKGIEEVRKLYKI